MGDAEDAFGLIPRLGQGRVHFAGVDRREDEKLVAPDNRGGATITLDRRLPLDVVGWAPLDGRLGRGGDAIGIRSAPVMPVVGLGLLKLIRMRLAKRERRGDQAKRCERGDFVQCHFLFIHFRFIRQIPSLRIWVGVTHRTKGNRILPLFCPVHAAIRSLSMIAETVLGFQCLRRVLVR